MYETLHLLAMLKRLFGLHFEVAPDNASVTYRIDPSTVFKVLFFINASKRKSIDTTGKSALKLVTLPSLNVRGKRTFTDIYIVGHEFVPHHTNVGQIYRLFGAISSLVFNK